jgi:hypothetical protein
MIGNKLSTADLLDLLPAQAPPPDFAARVIAACEPPRVANRRANFWYATAIAVALVIVPLSFVVQGNRLRDRNSFAELPSPDLGLTHD